MLSNYKRLGDYIQEVNIRNSDLNNIPLLGVSIRKVLMPSIANIIGTDMSTYKLIQKNQFAYGPVTSRNGDKISIALLEECNSAMVSQAYIVFEVIGESELLPEYLMMWFRRPEFDRYARFMSHGSAREIFSWTEMCETLLPIPSIEKQREIVREYNTIQNRITLNNQLISKLEETAKGIYKQWFVEFEFPNEYGKPYKSNSGKMVWCEELEKEIPQVWKLGTLENLYKFQYGLGNTNPNNNGQYPIYGAGGVIGGYDKYNSEDAPVIGHMGAYCGAVVFAFGKHYVTYNGVICKAKTEKHKWFSYLSLLSKDLMSNTRGSSQPFVSYDMLYEIQIIIPNEKVADEFDYLVNILFKEINLIHLENQKLEELKDLLLAKMTRVETKTQLA
jgi:type I restriction enzyme S subunit